MIFLIDLLFAKTVLFEKPKDTVKVDKIKKTRPVYQGNLPNYHRNGRQKVEFMALTSDKEELISHLFKDGSTYNIKLISDVYAYRDKETPIIATYKRGQSLITLDITVILAIIIEIYYCRILLSYTDYMHCVYISSPHGIRIRSRLISTKHS